MKTVAGQHIKENLKQNAKKEIIEKGPRNPQKKGMWKGHPYRGKDCFYKKNDPQEQQPQMAAETFVKVFHTDNPEDRESLEKIYNKVARNRYEIAEEQKEYNPAREAWDVLIIYCELYYTDPETYSKE